MKKPVIRRFKIQERVDIKARDRSNKPFLLTRTWRTVSQCDKLPTAESALAGWQHDKPATQFRITEEWPIGSEQSVIKP